MDTFLGVLSYIGLPSALLGFFFWLIKKELTKREKVREEADAKKEAAREQKEEERDKAREEHSVLLTQAVFASLSLGEATAQTLMEERASEGKPEDREMQKALDYAVSVKHSTKDFLTKQGIKNFS